MINPQGNIESANNTSQTKMKMPIVKKPIQYKIIRKRGKSNPLPSMEVGKSITEIRYERLHPKPLQALSPPEVESKHVTEIQKVLDTIEATRNALNESFDIKGNAIGVIASRKPFRRTFYGLENVNDGKAPINWNGETSIVYDVTIDANGKVIARNKVEEMGKVKRWGNVNPSFDLADIQEQKRIANLKPLTRFQIACAYVGNAMAKRIVTHSRGKEVSHMFAEFKEEGLSGFLTAIALQPMSGDYSSWAWDFHGPLPEGAPERYKGRKTRSAALTLLRWQYGRAIQRDEKGHTVNAQRRKVIGYAKGKTIFEKSPLAFAWSAGFATADKLLRHFCEEESMTAFHELNNNNASTDWKEGETKARKLLLKARFNMQRVAIEAITGTNRKIRSNKRKAMKLLLRAYLYHVACLENRAFLFKKAVTFKTNSGKTVGKRNLNNEFKLVFNMLTGQNGFNMGNDDRETEVFLYPLFLVSNGVCYSAKPEHDVIKFRVEKVGKPLKGFGIL